MARTTKAQEKARAAKLAKIDPSTRYGVEFEADGGADYGQMIHKTLGEAIEDAKGMLLMQDDVRIARVHILDYSEAAEDRFSDYDYDPEWGVDLAARFTQEQVRAEDAAANAF